VPNYINNTYHKVPAQVYKKNSPMGYSFQPAGTGLPFGYSSCIVEALPLCLD